MITQTTSNTLKTLRHWLLVCWLLVALPTAAAADELVGRVVSAVGEVIAIRPDEGELALQRRSEIHIGDTLVTGENGRAQIRFVDDGLVDLRPNSELLIENYAEPTEEEGGSAVLEFSRGALRTVSGTIGQNPDDEYRMETTAASIGIRGTDYALQYCDAACVDAGGTGGLYGRINDGGITVTNLAGTQDFDSGQFFNVVDQNTLPTPVPRPPAGILDGNEGGENGDDEDEDEIEEIGLDEPDEDEDGDDDDAPDLISQSVDPVSTSSTVSVDESQISITRAMVGFFAYTYHGEADGVASTYFGNIIRQPQGSNVISLNSDGNQVVEANFGDGTSVTVLAESTEYGEVLDWDSDATVYWGKWLTRFFDVQKGGSDIQIDGTGVNADFQYYFSDDLTTHGQLEQLSSLSGTVSYSHRVVDSDFNQNFLFSLNTGEDFIYMGGNALTLDVDFANVQADLGISFSDGDESTFYSVATGMQSADSLFLLDMDFQGGWQEYFEGDVVADGSLDGTFSGQFVGETADGVLFSFTIDQLDDNEELMDIIFGAGLLADEALMGH